MPSLAERATSNLDLSGYEPVEKPAPNHSGIGMSNNLEPGLNVFLRCPLPPVWQTTSDSLRQFYQNNVVPQTRLFNPPSNNGSTGGGGTSTTVVSSSGSSSSSTTTTLSVSQLSIATPLISPGNSYAGSFTFGKSFQLMTVTASSACRIRLYGTKQAQLNDAVRGLDVPPAAGTTQGIICDLALDTSPYIWQFQDRVGSNGDNPVTSTIYINVTNLDVLSDIVTLTFEYVPIVI